MRIFLVQEKAKVETIHIQCYLTYKLRGRKCKLVKKKHSETPLPNFVLEGVKKGKQKVVFALK